jgi:hypothetical protein
MQNQTIDLCTFLRGTDTVTSLEVFVDGPAT